VKGYLLDTNVLIALLWPSHAQHTRAVRWFTRHRSNGWATCPFTQAGFVRIVSNPAFSRDAVTPRDAVGVLAANTASKDHAFWPDELPLAEAIAFAGSKLLGHQQVTDAYLLGLVLRRGGRLATLDERITALTEPDSVQRRAVEVIA
jgi:toxin-antitoxin system PIN domain toxin